MTTPTVNDYIIRVRAIMATVNGIGTDVSDGVDLATAPGFEVYAGEAQHQHQGNRSRNVSQTITTRVYYVDLTNSDLSKEPPIASAANTVQAVIESYVDVLFAHINLALNDGGLARTGDVRTRMGLMPYNGRTYFGFDLDLELFFTRR